MNEIQTHVNFDEKNFKEKISHNLISFVHILHHNILETQKLDCSKSDIMMIGAISEIYLKCEYETTLELHFNFIYGNDKKESLTHQVITNSNIHSQNLNPVFSSHENIGNILDAFDNLYIKQPYQIREFLASFINRASFVPNQTDYQDFLKEFYPQYEKEQLDKNIQDNHHLKKIKL